MAGLIQYKANTGVSASFDSNVAAGSRIVVFCWTSGSAGATATCSDTQGNTYINQTYQAGAAINSDQVGCFTAIASASGPLTVTVDRSSIIIAEVDAAYVFERVLKNISAPYQVHPPLDTGYSSGNIMLPPAIADTLILTGAMLNGSTLGAGVTSSKTGDAFVVCAGTPTDPNISMFQRNETGPDNIDNDKFTFIEVGPDNPTVFTHCIAVALSKPLTRPLGLTEQFFSNTAMGDNSAPLGPDYFPSGGLWSMRCYGSFPYLPQIGDSIVIGLCIPNAAGAGGHIPTADLTDNGGNTYTFRGISTQGGVNGNQILIYTSVVTGLPASGLLQVYAQRTDSAIVQNFEALSICGAAYSAVLDFDNTELYLQASNSGTNPTLFVTDPATVAANSMLIVVAMSAPPALQPGENDFTETAGFTRRTQFNGFPNAYTPSIGIVGSCALFDKTVSPGTYTGEALTSSATSNIIMLAVPILGFSLTCPLSETVTVGTPVNVDLTDLTVAGTPPFTYAVQDGFSLPPGLSLSSDGIISGTPTTSGSYLVSFVVTDSNGNTAIADCCPILITVNVPVSSSCRTTLYLWQHSVAPQVEIQADRNDDWTNCGTPRLKFFQGFLLDADTFGNNKVLAFRAGDTGILHTQQPSPINHIGRQTKSYSFPTPFVAHSIRRESTDSVPWRKFNLQYIWERTPEFAFTWKTQRTAHGLSGFHFIARMLIPYAALADVTLTITAFDGTSPAVIILPSTAGVYKKIVVVPTFNKGLLFEYLFNATPIEQCIGFNGAFQLWENDLEVQVGQWGRGATLTNYPLVGDQRGDLATI